MMKVVVILLLIGVAAAACSEPTAYYALSYETAAAYLNVNTNNMTMSGGTFGSMVRDAVSMRVFQKYHMISDLTGDVQMDLWGFYDPSGNPDNTTICILQSGYCSCQHTYGIWQPLVPPTAYVTGKRTVMSGAQALVYNNDTAMYFVEMAVDTNCVPATIRQINRYDLGYQMGGALTSFFNYLPLTAAQAQQYFVLPPSCYWPTADGNAASTNQHAARKVPLFMPF